MLWVIPIQFQMQRCHDFAGLPAFLAPSKGGNLVQLDVEYDCKLTDENPKRKTFTEQCSVVQLVASLRQDLIVQIPILRSSNFFYFLKDTVPKLNITHCIFFN